MRLESRLTNLFNQLEQDSHTVRIELADGLNLRNKKEPKDIIGTNVLELGKAGTEDIIFLYISGDPWPGAISGGRYSQQQNARLTHLKLLASNVMTSERMELAGNLLKRARST